jgi:cytochrome P450
MEVTMKDVPAHVPPDLVFPMPILKTRTIESNPYDSMVPSFHKNPAIFYTLDSPIAPRGAWVPRRVQDLRVIYANTDHFTRNGAGKYAKIIGDSWILVPNEVDPPLHTAFRAVLNPVFSPSNMVALDGWVRNRAQEWIATFRDQDRCEFLQAFATVFPVSIFLDLLGLPQEEMPKLLHWERNLLQYADMEVKAITARAVRDYLIAAIDERIAEPRDDLISNCMRLKVDGRAWTRDEMLGHCFNLYLGGLDTITANMGLHFYHLATNLDHQRHLRSNPDKIPLAIEEFLRYYAVVSTARVCKERFEIGGIVMEAGDQVVMSTPVAGRDPDTYEDANVVKLDRRPAHVSLGFGPHRCLGQHLARRELQIGMQELLAALPEFHLDTSEPIKFQTGTVMHVDSVPLIWA